MRALVVDDIAINRLVLRELLKVVGIEAAEAESASDGLALLAIERFDIVLMDLRMPGMDGLAAIRKIREGENGEPPMPVIVVTADEAADLAKRCAAAGADHLIRKPVIYSDLVAALVAAFERPPELADQAQA